MKNSIPLCSLAVLFCLGASGACGRVSSLIHDDGVVVRFGDEKLLESDLDFAVPEYLSPEDSAAFADNFVQRWVMDRLYTKVAEDELSESEKDVSAELEDYRRSLLRFRYEQRYVADRLDTTVTETQIKDYYGAHREMFELERPVLKFRYVDIPRNYPDAKALIRAMSSYDYSENEYARRMSDSVAVRYIDCTDVWTDAAVLAKEFGLSWQEMLHLKSGSEIRLDLEDRSDIRVAVICDERDSGVAPAEFCRSRIREIILSGRKHELLKSLEQDLLDDALDRKMLVIHEYE